MKTLAPKTAQDPFTSLLGGSDSGSGGSTAGSLNVKGYAARELYLRHLEEDAKVVEVIRKNARQELGISPDREEPSLLRSYLEQRIAVSDRKTMGRLMRGKRAPEQKGHNRTAPEVRMETLSYQCSFFLHEHYLL